MSRKTAAVPHDPHPLLINTVTPFRENRFGISLRARCSAVLNVKRKRLSFRLIEISFVGCNYYRNSTNREILEYLG